MYFTKFYVWILMWLVKNTVHSGCSFSSCTATCMCASMCVCVCVCELAMPRSKRLVWWMTELSLQLAVTSQTVPLTQVGYTCTALHCSTAYNLDYISTQYECLLLEHCSLSGMLLVGVHSRWCEQLPYYNALQCAAFKQQSPEFVACQQSLKNTHVL